MGNGIEVLDIIGSDWNDLKGYGLKPWNDF